ncbi:hypothetical protein Tco_1484135 [Tanacetum coccineum]
MDVLNKTELGEGIQQCPLIPQTHTHHFKSIKHLNLKRLKNLGKSKRKDTQVPHPSGPTNIVADEAVHKELGDRLAKEEQEKRLEQVSTKKQKVDEDKGTAELQSLMEITPDEEEVTIDVVPLVVNSPSIVGWNRSITKERKAHSQISEKLAYQHSEISHKAKESKKYLLNADGLLLLFIDFNAVSVKVSAAR